MRGRLAIVALVSSLGALTLACHGGVLLLGEQYGYRDAAHYYYPLHQKIQQEWSSGRLPLWDPSENAGMPLLGNPTAAVLYPGKLIFGAVSYPLAARLYVVGHNLLAFAALFALLRSWDISLVGSGLGSLAYAFGAPVLFQYSNVIYLVGAAWAPLGILAADRWIRRGDRRAIGGLAVVLAMELLGGDPETAYLTGLFSVGYAVCVARSRRAEPAEDDRVGTGRSWVKLAIVVLVLAGWSLVTLAIARWGPSWRRPISSDGVVSALPWVRWVSPVVNGAWLALGAVILIRWRRSARMGRRSLLAPALAGLAASAVLAVLLSGAQLLPVIEFMSQSGRVVGGGSHEIFAFSTRPIRVFEFLWPNASGTSFHGNHAWLDSPGWGGKPAKVWVPSLYVGALTIVLALAAFRFRSGALCRRWMSAVCLVSLLASFGEYASPIWVARHFSEATHSIGAHDPINGSVLREDGKLRDGDGSFYWALATFLPGFRQFRFPSKFLTFTALGLATLAGMGWDLLASGEAGSRARLLGWSSVLLGLSLLALLAASIRGEGFLSGLAGKPEESIGPIDISGAFFDLRRGLAQGSLVFGCVLAALVLKVGHGGKSAVLALALMTIDLGSANAGLVSTVPQRLFDEPPEVLKILEASEREHPSDGPFRIHRMPAWEPVGWSKNSSSDRESEFVAWERRTLQPKYGIPLGLQYTMTIGVAELRDYQAFFRGYLREADAALAFRLQTKLGRPVVIYPRRAFDFWNTRYFIVPSFPNHWNDRDRGFASFLERTEPIYPAVADFQGNAARDKIRDWIMTSDFQVRRNLEAYPRAWVVHQARETSGIDEILFSEDDLWLDPKRTVHNPRNVAWLEPGRIRKLAGFLDKKSPGSPEKIVISRYESDRIELQVALDRPGLVVLADVFYPGWTLTIDGIDAPIERANGMMRGAAVPAGDHTLVFSYRPKSFLIGLILSGLGLATLFTFGYVSARRVKMR